MKRGLKSIKSLLAVCLLGVGAMVAFQAHAADPEELPICDKTCMDGVSSALNDQVRGKHTCFDEADAGVCDAYIKNLKLKGGPAAEGSASPLVDTKTLLEYARSAFENRSSCDPNDARSRVRIERGTLCFVRLKATISALPQSAQDAIHRKYPIAP